MDNVVSPGFTLANQTGQNVAFPILQKGDTVLHPTNACKSARPMHIFKPNLLKLSIISIFLNFGP